MPLLHCAPLQPDPKSWEPDSIDTLLEDVDFFKMNLTAGNVVTIINDLGHNWDEADVLIRLFDASKNLIESWGNGVRAYISHSGVYYIVISYYCKYDYWEKYCLSIRQESAAIELLSPNAGESFTAGQTTAINWTADPVLGSLQLSYSMNNGSSWSTINYVLNNNNNFAWSIPALKTRTGQALVKAAAYGITNGPFDVSNGTFTIQAAPYADDPYEPNNDFSSAYPVAVGDSVVKNASICWYADTPDSTGIDRDFFKINLTAGSLAGIRSLVTEGKNGPVTVFDASQNILNDFNFSGYYYYIPESGVYYIRMSPSGKGDWSKYGLSIISAKIISTQTSKIERAAMQYDSSLQVYRVQLNADTTKLAVDFTLNDPFGQWITTMTLAPNDCAPLPDEKEKVKAIAIFLDAIFCVNSADITIPYTLSDLKGYPENTLAAVRDDWSNGVWDSVPSTVDTARHQIIIHAAPLTKGNLYQVYVKSNTGIGPFSTRNPPVFGIRANVLSRKQSIAVHFALATATNAELRLYDVQGKCVRRGTFPVRPGGSTLLWNLGALSNGKYILTVKAGLYGTQETLLIIK